MPTNFCLWTRPRSSRHSWCTSCLAGCRRSPRMPSGDPTRSRRSVTTQRFSPPGQRVSTARRAPTCSVEVRGGGCSRKGAATLSLGILAARQATCTHEEQDPASLGEVGRHSHMAVVGIFVAILVALVLGVVLSLYVAGAAAPLMEETKQIVDADKRVAVQKDLLQYQADNQAKIWTAIVQGLGAIVLAIGRSFTW